MQLGRGLGGRGIVEESENLPPRVAAPALVVFSQGVGTRIRPPDCGAPLSHRPNSQPAIRRGSRVPPGRSRRPRAGPSGRVPAGDTGPGGGGVRARQSRAAAEQGRDRAGPLQSRAAAEQGRGRVGPQHLTPQHSPTPRKVLQLSIAPPPPLVSSVRRGGGAPARAKRGLGRSTSTIRLQRTGVLGKAGACGSRPGRAITVKLASRRGRSLPMSAAHSGRPPCTPCRPGRRRASPSARRGAAPALSVPLSGVRSAQATRRRCGHR